MVAAFSKGSGHLAMEILSHKNYRELLDFLPVIKASLKEWQLVDVRLVDEDEKLTPNETGEMIRTLFKDFDGKIYLCNDHDIFMLIRWGQTADPMQIPKRIENTLPPGSCEVQVQQPTPEGLQKLVVQIRLGRPQENASCADTRAARRGNVVLVADDDMYMRTLLKKGVATHAACYEVDNGKEVMAAYKKYMPDILFLDIHLPGRTGIDILSEVMEADPNAYVIMFSADSSRDKVEQTIQNGAKGFMTKPFSRERLNEYIKNCPTFSFAQAS